MPLNFILEFITFVVIYKDIILSLLKSKPPFFVCLIIHSCLTPIAGNNERLLATILIMVCKKLIADKVSNWLEFIIGFFQKENIICDRAFKSITHSCVLVHF